MRAHVKEILIFTGILTASLFLFQFLLKKGVTFSYSSQTGKVNRVFNHEIKNDLVVFGSSVAEVGICTNVLAKKLNRSAYNLAIDGTAFPQFKCLVEELSDYSKETKYVLFAVTYFDFSKPLLAEPSRFYAHLENPYVFEALKNIDANKITKMCYVPFYSITQYSHSFYKNSALGWKNYFAKTKAIDTLNGWVPHYSKFTNTLSGVNTTKVHLSLDSTQINSFLKLRRRLEENGKEIIIVFMPMHKAGQAHFDNLKEIVSRIGALVEPNHFVDYTSSIYCDDENNFYNNNHLNAIGAIRVTEDLTNQLLTRGLFLHQNRPQ